MFWNLVVAGFAAGGLTSVVASPFRARQVVTTARSTTDSTIWVTDVPTTLQTYAIAHLNAGGAVVGQQYYRFPVTGESSDNAFTLICTNAPGSTSLGVLPHLHEVHYENFFNSRGRFQLWADKNGTDETQIFLPGDFGAVPENTTHTFQILDDDTEMTGIIFPGGFEKLFYHLGDSNFTGGSTDSPYDPSISATNSTPSAAVIASLGSYDVVAELDYVSGPVSANTTWHSAANTLPSTAGTPYMIAQNFGPKYLNSDSTYKVIQPLIEPTQSSGNFTMSTIAMEKTGENTTTVSTPGHAAFQVLLGNLQVTIGNETVSLINGDVIFIPGSTEYSYGNPVLDTKVLYISQGSEGLDQTLIDAATAWNSSVWPMN